MRAEHAVDEVAADQAQAVDLALFERGAETVGIVTAGAGAVPGLDLDFVEGSTFALHARDVEPVGMNALERDALPARDEAGCLRLGQDRTDLPGTRRNLMRPEDAERVAVIGRHHGRNGIGMEVAIARLRGGAAHTGSPLAAKRIRRPGRARRLGRA
ncbi:hypothetical protein M2437_004045 [Methylorubrum pseudosasae]|nr:hypothetical protein [Methylorubrum pseudosasae]